MRISDWSSDVCSSDLLVDRVVVPVAHRDIKQRHEDRRDALLVGHPSFGVRRRNRKPGRQARSASRICLLAEAVEQVGSALAVVGLPGVSFRATGKPLRSEEHTSELQSLMRISYAVFCLKKKKQSA